MDLIQIGEPPCCHDVAQGDTHLDPVCGMTVEAATAAGTFHFAGRDYYFCSRHCLERFRSDPAAYLTEKRRPAPQAMPGVDYTCPMHPEVVQQGPGTCPKCGMALERMLPTAEEGL